MASGKKIETPEYVRNDEMVPNSRADRTCRLPLSAAIP